jgi:cyclopropane-fatty-acyl-phospholipid synthase
MRSIVDAAAASHEVVSPPTEAHVARAHLAPAARATSTRLDRWLATRLQSRIARSHIGIVLWDGWSPPAEPASPGALVLADRRALIGLIANPDLQFGECYSQGRLDVDGGFPEVLEALSRLDVGSAATWREQLAMIAPPANGRLAARRNIHHHYDLGNDFYRLWLDTQLVYTCAYYPDHSASLEAAQEAKLDLVCRKLALRPGERVVETGCGWGALALHMARHYGVHVTAYNISTAQVAHARARAEREGLARQVRFVQDDYRNVTGTFDVFVSVGMLEHVGRRNFKALAGVIARTLDRRHGRGLLHFIGRDRPRPINAWTRRRIFPGSYAPTLDEAARDVLRPAGQSVLDVENLRFHYARTLREWRERFEQAEAPVRERFGEAFYRAWRLYLGASEAAFSAGWLQLFQVVFAPAGGGALRWTREALYARDRDTP